MRNSIRIKIESVAATNARITSSVGNSVGIASIMKEPMIADVVLPCES
jgi:hypothetical protein